MSLANIEIFLKETMGLNPDSIGSSTISRDINVRMKACALDSYDEYFQLLLTDKNEVRKLIEEVIVAETWFFRDQKPYDALGNFVQKEWKMDKELKVLSLPCSTGEEAYSIAMTLIEAGLPTSRFSITAMDISQENIKAAKEAIYTENSFRGTREWQRQKYFHKDGKLYLLKDEIKKRVKFCRKNIFEIDVAEGIAQYHVIFCRNLLIYFARDTQKMAISIFKLMLDKNGLLFTGHAETSPFLEEWFPSRLYSNAFAFRLHNDLPGHGHLHSKKKGHAKQKRLLVNKPPHNRTPHKNKRDNNVKPFTLHTRKDKSSTDNKPHNKIFNSANALSLANEGHLGEAAKLCEQHLENAGPDIDAFMVLALVRDATGSKEEAIDYLRKAIYLEPDHYDALMYLAALTERAGKKEESQILRQRAERIHEKDRKHISGVKK